ncbi:MAG: transaldolase [Gaiellaceae bacterium]
MSGPSNRERSADRPSRLRKGNTGEANRWAVRAGAPSDGDLLRAASAKVTLGWVAPLLSQGALVPDQVAIELIRERLAQDDGRVGFVLDGFPRNLAQAEALDRQLDELGRPLSIVLEFQISDAVCVKRLLKRGPEAGRLDDRPDVIARRLEVYHRETEPLPRHYRTTGRRVAAIHAERPIDEVWREIRQALDPLASEGTTTTARERTAMPMSRLHRLSALGQSVWLDALSRAMIEGGQLARHVRGDAVVGVTSNPTIFQRALEKDSCYDEQLHELVRSGETDPKQIFLRLAARDIDEATDLLRPIWAETEGLDGYVSWEVDPALADDRERTIAEARRLHELIGKPNLHVKIPATLPGLGAVEAMIAEGRNVNVTLIFSLARHQEVMEAYIRGLERLVERRSDPSKVRSVASFFVSRVDTETDRRLEELGRTDLQGKLAIANAKLAFQNYKQTFSGSRWRRLARMGAHTQRCLWASTSTKNLAYRDVLYVEQLIGPDTVDTMPEETIRAFQDHGVVAETLEQGLDEAHSLFENVREAGVDYDDVCTTLERQGVERFARSFDDLLDSIRAKRKQLAAAA